MIAPPLVFIGSTVTDIRIQDDHKDELSLGGCAYNAAWIAHLMNVPYLLFSPIGINRYADFVRNRCAEKKLSRYPLESEEENGCCYCRIDEHGERSFECIHGAEYHYKKEWFSILDAMDITTVYICGLEIEEESGRYIIDYLKRHPHLTIYFACGPRILHIDPSRMKELFSCSPILHLNRVELLSFTNCTNIEEAAKQLYEQTHNKIVITLGADGSCYYDGALHMFAPEKAKQIDTTGAGDAHAGTLISAVAAGCSFDEAMTLANKVAAKVVAHYGAALSDTDFQILKELIPTHFNH